MKKMEVIGATIIPVSMQVVHTRTPPPRRPFDRERDIPCPPFPYPPPCGQVKEIRENTIPWHDRGRDAEVLSLDERRGAES
jgi:hypothetical protein